MKHIKILTAVAGLSLAAFLLSFVLGLAAMPLFVSTVVAWVALLSAHAYTPRRSFQPRLAPGAVRIPNYRRNASLPLAA